jgi:signal transduction histidine kinase
MRLFPKLLLSFLAVALVGVLVVSVLANQATTREVRRFMVAGGLGPQQILAENLAGYYRGHGSWEGVEPLLAREQGRGPMGMGMGKGMPAGRLILIDLQNRVMADSSGGLLGQPFRAAADDTTTPVEVDGLRVGSLITQGGLAAPGSDLLARVNLGIWLAALAAGLVALGMAGALAYNLVHPIQQVTDAAGAVAQGDLSRRVTVTSKDEVGKLAVAFNAMASDLEKAERLRRDMTADIAHELRNPLAVLQGNLEAVMDGILPPTPETWQPLLDQTLLLARLIEDLRTLSLAEAGQLRLDRVPTDPAALMQSALAQFNAPASAKHIPLRAEIAEGLPALSLDSQRMAQVLGNLLSNALRYTPAGNTITGRVTGDALSVTFEVEDTGPGIPPEVLPHLFERFYRAGAPPANGGSETSTGLGLAIAKQLVELHGGRIAVASRAGQGTTVSVTLPAA